jgi:hypothetical protein
LTKKLRAVAAGIFIRLKPAFSLAYQASQWIAHGAKEDTMKTNQFGFMSALIGAALICIGVIGPCARTVAVAADEPKAATPQVALADTYNAVTRVYFNNTAAHKGSHKPGLVERRFRADVKYWLMDAKYYDRGELSVGNPPLVDLVRKLGSKNLPQSEPTTLSAMAYEIARGVLEQYPIMQRIEIFSRGLEIADESQDNHVVNLVLQR